jgi:hypothetical protein
MFPALYVSANPTGLRSMMGERKDSNRPMAKQIPKPMRRVWRLMRQLSPSSPIREPVSFWGGPTTTLLRASIGYEPNQVPAGLGCGDEAAECQLAVATDRHSRHATNDGQVCWSPPTAHRFPNFSMAAAGTGVPEGTLKVLLVGPSKSGKSRIANYFGGLADSIDLTTGTYEPTHGVRIIEVEREVPGRGVLRAEIWDVSGNTSFEGCWPAISKDAMGTILCFNGADEVQQQSLELWFVARGSWWHVCECCVVQALCVRIVL